MTRPLRYLLAPALALAVLLLFAGTLHAQTAAPGAPDTTDATLDTARKQVQDIERKLAGAMTDAQVVDTRRALFDIQQRSDVIATEQAPALASAKARLAELGAVPEGGKEAPDVAEQRLSLQKTTDALDARIRLARLLVVETGQLADRLGDQWRARFRAQLFERTDSVLSTAFWHDLRSGASRDRARLGQLGQQLVDAVARTSLLVWLAALAAIAATYALRFGAVRLIGRIAEKRIPSGRVRRSLYATLRVLISVSVAALVAFIVVMALTADPASAASLQPLLFRAVGVVSYTGFVVGLGNAMLAARRHSWRLLPLPDTIARGLRRQPLVIGVLVFVGWLLPRICAVAQVNVATEVAVNGLQALALAWAMAHAVGRGSRLHLHVARAAAADSVDPAHAAAGMAPPPVPRPWWLKLGLFAVWATLVASMLGIVLGYAAMGSFVVKQVLWVCVLGLTAYLLTTLVDDAFDAWLGTAPASATGAEPPPMPSTGTSLRRQAMVITSGALRLFIVLVALVLVLAPFGESPDELARRANLLSDGVAVGELQVKPAIVLQALLVFGLSIAGVRMLNRWLVERYLPTTTLDAGMRSSLATLLGFLGTVLAIGFGLSAIGLALDKVAWIASALSVGIGFGLQAVVSNFVSGLILLAERPVKVGDWVALGGVEGDIRRINVRATEIQMGDRSTLIVPNSEFITKVVRNVTHDSPLGLVTIKLPMPIDTDTDRARQILMDAFVNHPDVLDVPAPNVFLDGIEAGNLVFNANGFVGSPRQSYGVRSALLFEVLKSLPAAGLPLSRRPTMVLKEVPAESPLVPPVPSMPPMPPVPT